MDVITILKADHRKVDELFAQIEAASERAVKTKRKVFMQIKEELTVHAAVEEELLYPRMKELRELRHNAFEADEEHRLVKQLLAEITELGEDGATALATGQNEPSGKSAQGNGGDERGAQWNAKVKVLKDLVQHHVREEEGEMFKGLKAELGRDELRELGEAVLAFKESFQAKATAPRAKAEPMQEMAAAV